MPRLFMPLNMLIHLFFGQETGIYFIDSTTIKACHNKRRYSNKIFKGLAKHREIMALKVTKGNVDDRTPVAKLTKGLTGIMAADKG
ncbi:unnamed protein product, partial [Rotaria sordida]